MQGLQRRVFITMALAWCSTAAAAQFAPPQPFDTNDVRADARYLFDHGLEYVLPSPYLQPAEVRLEGAKYVKLHFSEFSLPVGMAVEISNPDGSEVWRYSASDRDLFTIDEANGDDGAQAFWAMSISGDTAIVRYTGLTSLFDPAVHSVTIDDWTRDQPADSGKKTSASKSSGSAIETTCGESEQYDAVCWTDSYPDMYERSSPVAMIITATGKQCTAWRAGHDNRLFTARHCVGSQSTLDGAEVWFNYEASYCGGEETGEVVKVTGDELLVSDYYLDFTLFTVNDFSKVKGFGNLGLDVRDGDVGEGIFIPQHGSGAPKQIAIESDMNNGGLCEIDDNAVDGFIEGSDIGYFCDTGTSSSGSPVISAVTGKAIALHHYGGCLNSGTKVALIWPHVSGHFGGVVPEGDADGDWAKGNELPVARFTHSCDGLECSFDAATSDDAEGPIASYLWDFDDGATAETQTVEHGFEIAGEYQVALTVFDDEGASDTIIHTVSVSASNEDPTASFSAVCVDNECSFDGSGSSDADGSVTSWKWNLGDGATADGAKTEHAYSEAGTYTVTLTVEDDGTAKDSTSRTVTVSMPNAAPTAHFSLACDNLICSVDASGSTDPDGAIDGYDWDFGDGQTASGESAQVSYKKTGSYSIRLTVTDDEGDADSKVRQVSVEAENVPPKAAFSGSCEDNVCSFDASPSSDSDGDIADYTWTFPDGSRASGETVEHSFDDAGLQTVRLVVTDDRGAEDSAEQNFEISMPSEPVASFTVKCEERKCTLDAGDSIASAGSITNYDWSLGDGEYATGSSVTHEYDEDGSYQVILKITDSSKSNTTSQKTIRIEATKPLQLDAEFVITPKHTLAVLHWTGASESRVEIYRNAVLVGAVSGPNSFTDHSLKGTDSPVSYRVCESDSNRCSNIVKLGLEK